MKIEIHRGLQIGGCITEIQNNKGKRIIIDCGSNLPGNEEEKSVDIEKITSGCEGVFITHYHEDHVGDYKKVSDGVPIYIGEAAKEIFFHLKETIHKIQKNKIQNKKLEDDEEYITDDEEYVTDDDLKKIKNFETFSDGEPIIIEDDNCCDSIKVTPLMIDHSAYDAYMFLVECDGKRVLHTGDFRMHGHLGSKISNVLRKYAQYIDVLICEGTMFSRNNEYIMTEEELGRKASELLKDNKNVFVFCSSTNIDRILTFHNAVPINTPKKLICDKYQHTILKIVKDSAKNHIFEFKLEDNNDKHKKIYVIDADDRRNAGLLKDMKKDHGFCMLIRSNELCKKIIEKFPNSLLIYSMWDGYLEMDTEKMPKKYKKYSDMVEFAKSKEVQIIRLHTSGHATIDAIRKVCEITTPEYIIPIHTNSPERFKKLELDCQVKILKDGEYLEI